MKPWYYSALSFSYTFQQFLMRRLTPQGLAWFGALLITGTAGADTWQTLSYQIFAFILSLFLVAIVFSVRFVCPLKIHRILPRFGTVGEPLQYRIIIQNLSTRPQAGLQLFEVFADPRPSVSELKAAIGSEMARHPLKNFKPRGGLGQIAQQQWQDLIQRKQRATVKVLRFPPIPPKGRAEVLVELTPLHRGRVHFQGVVIARPDPLGLVNACRFVPLPQAFWLLPPRYPVPGVALAGTQRYQSGGVALATTVGDAEEFLSLRDYRPGDPLRKIHWKSWAKMDKPIVKEEQDEFFVRHALILDTFTAPANAPGSPSPASYSPKLEGAVSIAASFACHFETQDALLDLMFVGTEAYCFTTGRGLGHQEQMLEILAAVVPCVDQSFAYLTPEVLNRSSLLSGCICIFLTWDDDRAQLIHYLQALNLPVLVLLVEDTAEQNPLVLEPNTSLSVTIHSIPLDRLAESLSQII